MNKFIVWIVLVVLTCCSPKKEYSNHIELIKTSELVFELDELSTGISYYADLISINETPLFTFLNKKNNAIFGYRLDNPDSSFHLQYPIEGPKGVGVVSGYLMVNLDSIFLYSYNSHKVTLVDAQGNKKRTYSIDHENMNVIPEVNSSRKIFKYKNQLVFNSWGSQKEYYKNDYFEDNSFLFLDIETGKIEFDIHYPEIYKTGIWGMQLFQIFHDVNHPRAEVVINYPIDGKLYFYDLAKRKIFEKEIKGDVPLDINPLSKTAPKISIPYMEEIRNQKSQDVYSDIKYFSDKDLYIRVIDLKLKDDILSSGDPFKLSFGPKLLQIINSNFELIGELELPSNYSVSSMFFYNGKIYLERIQSENEDLLIFDIFDLKFM